jgi:oxygen-independent coproporphyrinogen-3 oxidase
MSDSELIDGLYVHVPFCDGKCAYCAFYSVPYSIESADAWLRAVQKERALLSGGGAALTPRTVYFGGGTPSLLSLSQLERLLDGVGTRKVEEWTVEANPGSLDAARLRLLTSYGVNRISLGVQSLDDRVLAFLGRRHTVAEAHAAVAAIQAAGVANWGLDLIACVPGVSRRQWGRTLEEALALGPQHVSVYALTSEEGSTLAGRVAAGGIRLLDDDDQLGMLALAEQVLCGAGYARYEISNYARSGRECLHNLSCWRGENYIGLGCAAASRVGARRWSNASDLKRYVEALEAGRLPPRDVEDLSPATDGLERLIFGLRMAEGVSLEAVLRGTGLEASPWATAWRVTLERLRGEGLLTLAGDRWTLTGRGVEVADHVAVELIP